MNEDLHLYDVQQKKWNWKFPSGNFSKDWLSNEAQVALFLNTVVSAVASSVATDRPTISPRKQRFWMADWSSQCLTGWTGYQQKPDLVLVSSAIVPWDEITWLSLKVIGEYSREPFQPASRLGKTMDTKAYLIMVDQPWRCYVLGLFLANEEFHVHFYNHSGGAISPPFNIHAEPDAFLYILSSIVFGVHSCIGFDMAITITLPPSYCRRQAIALLALASGESRKATATETDFPSLSAPSLQPVLEMRCYVSPEPGSLPPFEPHSLATDLPLSLSPVLETQHPLLSEPGSLPPLEPHSLATDIPLSLSLALETHHPHSPEPEPGSSPLVEPCSLTVDLPPSVSPFDTHTPTLERGSSPPLGSHALATDLPHQMSSLETRPSSAILSPSSPSLRSGDHALQFPAPEAPSPPEPMPSIGMILVHEDVYEIVDILFSSTGFLGRGTVCYLVCHKWKVLHH